MPDSEKVLAEYLNKQGSSFQDAGLYSDAEKPYKEALQIREKVLGPEHPSLATTLNNLAALYRSQGRYEEAEPLYKRAYAILLNKLGPNHPDTKTAKENRERMKEKQSAAKKD